MCHPGLLGQAVSLQVWADAVVWKPPRYPKLLRKLCPCTHLCSVLCLLPSELCLMDKEVVPSFRSGLEPSAF